MKQKEIKFLLSVAELAAKQSTAIRLKVGGCVTDKYGNIIATGYNGTVRGADNGCEEKVYRTSETNLGNHYPYYDELSKTQYRLVTKESVLHAEMNLITHAARRGISIDGGSVFLTHSPCVRCAPLLIQSGIKDIYFIDKFRTFDEVFNEFSNFINFIQYNT